MDPCEIMVYLKRYKDEISWDCKEHYDNKLRLFYYLFEITTEKGGARFYSYDIRTTADIDKYIKTNHNTCF